MKKEQTIFMLAVLVALVCFCIFSYRLGRNKGMMESDKYWTEAILSRHLGYLVHEDGKESYIELRYVPKVRKVPIIFRNDKGEEK